MYKNGNIIKKDVIINKEKNTYYRLYMIKIKNTKEKYYNKNCKNLRSKKGISKKYLETDNMKKFKISDIKNYIEKINKIKLTTRIRNIIKNIYDDILNFSNNNKIKGLKIKKNYNLFQIKSSSQFNDLFMTDFHL
jgi:hypothetical protein